MGSCHGTGGIRQKIAIVNGPFGRKPFTMANYWLSSWGNRSRWRLFGLTMANFWRNGGAGWHGLHWASEGAFRRRHRPERRRGTRLAQIALGAWGHRPAPPPFPGDGMGRGRQSGSSNASCVTSSALLPANRPQTPGETLHRARCTGHPGPVVRCLCRMAAANDPHPLKSIPKKIRYA